MTLPKSVIIAGKTWKIVLDKKERGAWYSGDKQEIHIGLKNVTQEHTRINFLHEVIEAIFSERLLRYKLPYTGADNGHYLFVMNHLQFENAVVDIGLALKEVLNRC